MEKLERKEIIKKKFRNPFIPGDIVHHSWGYDQTQCDYYQVTRTTKAGVTLKPIKNETVSGSEGFMSRSCMPVKDGFCKAYSALSQYDGMITEKKKRIMAYLEDSGELKYYIPTPYGWCNKWDGRQKYESSYA